MEQEKIKEKIKEKKSGRGLIISLIISIIIILGLVAYICYDKEIIFSDKKETKESTTIKKSTKDEKKESKEETDTSSAEESNESTSESKTKSKCYGTYYGEYTKDNYNLKYTYVLNEDGTFTFDAGGVSETSGIFVIIDNTITLIGHKEIVGPKEEDPYYTSVDYVIADDCSYFTYQELQTGHEEPISFKLYRK